ncbi:hypothetical protein H5410_046313 [Solanum commersonii]|uniref:Uncharacterized protein n=1 Tax=Solanum commersonii TaxID=4109 RepID=A0A9J5XE38_SOLCO|nr:hypothetical protein H5410_046313 [Solanum commersonii]
MNAHKARRSAQQVLSLASGLKRTFDNTVNNPTRPQLHHKNQVYKELTVQNGVGKSSTAQRHPKSRKSMATLV